MTIRTGINPEAVLWKYTDTYKRQVYNRETASYVMEDRTDYYVIRLATRRARTQGHTVQKELYPFFESIRIKLVPARVWRDGSEQTWYTAVGTRSDRVNKETYDSLEIDEVAQRWYSRIRNTNIVPLLDRRQFDFSDDIIEEMKAVAQDDDSEVESWPPEPSMREYRLELSAHYYRGSINWR
jgi:hypothetical protein